jgi:hypothetical protein
VAIGLAAPMDEVASSFSVDENDLALRTSGCSTRCTAGARRACRRSGGRDRVELRGGALALPTVHQIFVDVRADRGPAIQTGEAAVFDAAGQSTAGCERGPGGRTAVAVLLETLRHLKRKWCRLCSAFRSTWTAAARTALSPRPVGLTIDAAPASASHAIRRPLPRPRPGHPSKGTY